MEQKAQPTVGEVLEVTTTDNSMTLRSNMLRDFTDSLGQLAQEMIYVSHAGRQIPLYCKEGHASASGRDDAPITLMLEPAEGELDVLKLGFMSLRLKAGTTFREVHDLEKLLNSTIPSIGFTKL